MQHTHPVTRISIQLSPEQLEWVERRGEELEISRVQVIQRLVQEAREGRPVIVLEGDGPDTRSQQEKVLDAVREHFNLAPAAFAAGVTRDDIVAWCHDDKDFRKAIEEAQAHFIACVEKDLIEIGRGARKGSQKALEAFLAAHHPGYGRLKLELLRRILDPLVERLMKYLHQEFGPQASEQLARVQERFEREKQKRLVAFT